MGTNRWQERSFIEQVAAHHGCAVKRSRGDGDWELRATTGGIERPGIVWSGIEWSGIEWYCRLRPRGDEAPPEIRWLTPSVRFDEQRPVPLTVARHGLGGDGGGWDVTAGGWVGAAASAAMLGLGRLARRRAERAEAEQAQQAERAEAGADSRAEHGAAPAPPSVLGPGWSVQDPAGFVDAGIAGWFAAFPPAWRGGTGAEPSPIDSVWLSNDGLTVTATGWWDSAPALDHQIRLGLALAHRIRSVRGY